MGHSSVNLEKVKAQIQRYIPRGKLTGDTRFHAEWNYEIDAMAVRLERTVWSERLGDEEVRWPATWWDAVKDRWFPAWLKRRFPVEWKHADFTVYRGYPDIVRPSDRSTLFITRKA